MSLSFQPAARVDILRQFEYLLKKASPAIALRFRTKVEAAAHEAARDPAIGTPVFIAPGIADEVRSWPVPTFPGIRLYYIQQEDDIRVIRVLHGKRDILRILRRTQKPA